MQTHPITPRRRRWRRLAIAALVVGGALAAWAGWALYAASSFSGRIAAIRAAGDPASIADLAPKPIPADEDAAAQLAAVAPQIEAFARDHGRFFNTPLGKAYDEARGRGEPATSEQLSAIKTILDGFPEIDAAVTKAAACDRYGSRLDYSLPQPQFLNAALDSSIRTVARYGQWQMEVAMAEGRHADALQQGVELLRLGRLFQAEPGLIGGMVAAAIRDSAARVIYDSLAAGSAPAELHAALDRELAIQDDMQPFVLTLKSERAMVIEALQSQFGGMAGLFMNTVGRPMKMHHTAILDLFDAVLPLAAEPWHKVAGKSPPNAVFKKPTGLGTMADLLQPSIEGAYETANRSLAMTRSLRIYNALRQYAAKHGREAEGLADLRLPKEATTDPFSGEPMKLKRTDEGWVVYSVAKDGRDDGGLLREQNDYGVGPAKLRD